MISSEPPCTGARPADRQYGFHFAKVQWTDFEVIFWTMKRKARIKTTRRVSSPSADWSSLGPDFVFRPHAFILLQL